MSRWESVLEELCTARAQRRAGPVGTSRPASAWTEKVELGGKVVQAASLILRTAGCSWCSESGGCTMCGYSADSAPTPPGPGELGAQFTGAMASLAAKGVRPAVVKVYTSGSFFDDGEVPPDVRGAIIRGAWEAGARKVLVETRPEHVDPGKLESAMEAAGGRSRKGGGDAHEDGGGNGHEKSEDDEGEEGDMDGNRGTGAALEVAFGLETASDDVRARCVHKGFTFDDFARAAGVCRDKGAGVRAYLLLKPPFLGEGRAMSDSGESVDRLKGLADTVSLNPVNVQKDTVVETLWKKGMYRPPWLWSLVEVLRARPWKEGLKLISTPSGGGSARGVHNCGRCDSDVLRAVEAFSLTGDPGAFDGLDCRCRALWRAAVAGEDGLFQPGALDASHHTFRRL